MTDLAHDASWLTPAPTNWRVTRLAYVSSAIQTGPFGSQLHAEDYVDGGVPLINPSHIRDGRLLPNPDDSISEPTAHRLSRHRMRDGEVVFGRRGELGRCAVIRAEHQGWLCGTGSMVVRPVATAIDSEYLQLAASLSGAREWLQLQSVGSTMDNLNAAILGRLPVPLPAIGTQRRIVHALRGRTAALDALIAKKERLIELLQEKRQALITQAVTKGLDPNVSMKDSGVEWLGRIPAAWTLMPLRSLSRAGLSNGIFKKKEEFGTGSPLVNVYDVYRPNFAIAFDSLDRVAVTLSELARFGITKQDIFFVRSSLKREGIAKVACVRDLPEPTVFECHLVRAQLRETVANPMYMTYFLNSERARDRLIALSTTTTMTTIGQTSLGSLEVPVPPLKEQREILVMLEREEEHHFALVAKTSAVVERLREYRQALITAAVTGKIDVPKEAA